MKLAAKSKIAIILFVLASHFAARARAEQKYLTARDIRLINKHWADYEFAANKVGVPVLLLPSIHYRESNLLLGDWSKLLQKVTINRGGPFMLDCGKEPDGSGFQRRIRDYERKVYRACFGRGEAPLICKDFRFACVVAAYELGEKLRCRDWTADCLEDAVWGYNGRASWCSKDDSAYLWSDPKNGVNLTVTYRKNSGEKVRFVDGRPGVMIIYKELSNVADFKSVAKP